MPKIVNNPFLRFVRERYRGIGLHQADLAAALRTNPGSMSEYLTGKTRMPEHLFLTMCELLRLSQAEAKQAWLMHSLLHVPDNVRRYVEALEADRIARDMCDDRLERLRDLTSHLLHTRSEHGEWAPVLIDRDEGTSRITRAIHLPDDEETRG